MARRASKIAKADSPPRIPQTLFKLGAGGDPAAYEAERLRKYRELYNTPLGRWVLADFMMSMGFLAAPGPQERHLDGFIGGTRWVVAEHLKAAGIGQAEIARAVLHDNMDEAFNEGE